MNHLDFTSTDFYFPCNTYFNKAAWHTKWQKILYLLICLGNISYCELCSWVLSIWYMYQQTLQLFKLHLGNGKEISEVLPALYTNFMVSFSVQLLSSRVHTAYTSQSFIILHSLRRRYFVWYSIQNTTHKFLFITIVLPSFDTNESANLLTSIAAMGVLTVDDYVIKWAFSPHTHISVDANG